MLRRLILPAAAAAALLVFSAGAGAAGSTNVSCAAGGAGLVAAVNAVNSAGGGSINLDSGCTYSLTSADNSTFGKTGLPVVVTSVTINGKGATIAGNSSNFRIVAIDGSSGGALTLNGVTITGGKAAGPMLAGAGGGIANVGGTLTLNNALVTQNSASSAGGGVAMANGTMTMNKSEVSWNSVPGDTGSGGGGILSMASTLTVNNSTVDHNSGPGGGGIASGNGQGGGSPSSIVLNHSVISFNTAAGDPMSGGGGISNGGTLQSNDSQIVNNSAPGETGGGLLNHVTATLNHTVVSGNTAEGGLGGGIVNAIFFDGQPTPTLVLNNSDVTGNSADVGGGIVNTSFADTAPPGTVTLHHTDVSGNTPNNCVPVGSIAGCNDTVIVFTATLNGSNQNPPLGVSGTGSSKVTWNTATNEMTVDVTFSGLTTATTAAHIHCCIAPPGNTGVATTTPTFPGFPLGVTSGSYSRTFDMTAASSYNPAFVTAHGGTTTGAAAALLAGLQAGQAYLNIHTTMFPGGEIRGFLQQP
jgi:CHRD domain-containing protein